MKQLIPPTALFRFRFPCYRFPAPTKWNVDLLDDRYRLPNLAELDGRRPFADLRMAWDTDWLIWQVSVRGKKKAVWCRDGQLDESDGLHIFLDTRDTKGVQRGTRFCHHLVFLPAGGGSRKTAPTAQQDWLNNANAHPRPIRDDAWLTKSSVTKTGYKLLGAVATSALTGLDQVPGARLGFFYHVHDAELGDQTFALSREFGRFQDDPSLWGTLELEEALPGEPAGE